MATTTVSAWTKPGAWALDSEEQEAQESIERENDSQFNQQTQQQPLADFPSLSAAVTKPSKKKKSQPVSLAEFTTGKAVTYGAAKIQAQTQNRSVGLTPDELLVLPTGPRERTAEELERSSSRLGGGFRSYGTGSRDFERRSGGFDESNSARWGSPRVSEDQPRRSDGFSRESAPSRADEIDDWGAGKKSVAPAFERRERGGFFSDSQSRADESDSWVSSKSFTPTEGRRIGGGSGGGFEGYRERRVGFEMFKEGSNGNANADSDNWGKKREEVSARPRLNLQPRSIPVSNGDEKKVEGVARGKASNPFGEARPREEVLAEKGQDWKKIDEQLESLKIKEIGSRPVSSDGAAAFGKKSFGSGNGRVSPVGDRTEMNWRKAVSENVTPSAEEVEEQENGVVENAVAGIAEN